jgi:gliding motility-associated-like protein
MWNWDFGNGFKSTQNNPAYTYNMPGKYNTRLQITTLPGCFYSGGKSTIVHPKPKAYFTHDPDQGTIVNPNITFTDKSQGADSLWYVFSTGYKTRSRNFMHSLPDSGIFTITQYVSTTFGCRDSFTKQVVINYMYTQHVPTAFTPNEDNLNEGFAPAGMGIKWYAMKIYSRWGEKIYETRDSKSWNGTYNGEPVPEGVYVVLMELKDHKGRNHYYKGTVQILRKP